MVPPRKGRGLTGACTGLETMTIIELIALFLSAFIGSGLVILFKLGADHARQFRGRKKGHE